MTLALYPYQEVGRDFLLSKDHALLADDMGIGKTGQAIAASEMLAPRRILVLCPAGVRYNWDREFPRFSGQDLARTILFKGVDNPLAVGVTTTSYNLICGKTFRSKLMAEPWDLLICDEAHFLKNPYSKRTKAVFGPKCDGAKGLMSISKRVWLLTGTPMPNDVSEMYPMLKAFGKFAGTLDDFIQKYCRGYYNRYGFQITSTKNASEIKAMMKSISLRRRKHEVLKDLPLITFGNWVLDPKDCHPEYVKQLREAEGSHASEELIKLLERVESGDVVPGGTEPAAIATIFRLTGLAKVKPAVEQITKELEEGTLDKVVIFAINRDVLVSMKDQLSGFGSRLIFGGTKPERKQRHIEAFQTNPKVRVLLANIAAVGVGIDGLQDACNNIIFVQSSWNPSENAQAVSRVHRNGQKSTVLARFMSLAGSIDERVQEVLRQKTEMIQNILD